MESRTIDPKSRGFRHLSFIVDFKNTLTVEERIKTINKKLDEFENKMELDLIKVLENFQIHATVKTHKKSLPYNSEITIILPNESWVTGVLEFKRCYRKILKELLDKNLYKIRFYVSIEIVDHGFIGGLKYIFRYHTPNQTINGNS